MPFGLIVSEAVNLSGDGNHLKGCPGKKLSSKAYKEKLILWHILQESTSVQLV